MLAIIPSLALATEFKTPAITPERVAALQGTPEAMLVVDVRGAGEYKSGHVPGAVNIPHTKLTERLDQLRQAKGVVLYCIIGDRTLLAEQTLLESGLGNVYHLDGGLMGWRKAGLEVRTGWGP